MNSLNLEPCPICDFNLFHPVSVLAISEVALYDDARFPGRCIVKLIPHFEEFENLPEEMSLKYISDIKKTIQAIKDVTGVQRVNFAILGNTVSHVHAHLIPRYPDNEAFPGKSPWNDPRPSISLNEEERLTLINELQFVLKN